MRFFHGFKVLQNYPMRFKIFMRRKINTQSIFIRPLTEKDIPEVIELRKANSFQDAVSCYSIFLKTDPKNFMIIDNGHGKVVGFTSIFLNNSNFCTCGFRTIDPEYRNLRITTEKIYPKVLEIANGRSIIVHAEIDLVDWSLRKFPYFENKFVLLEFESEFPVDASKISIRLPENIFIRQFHKSYLQKIAEYDSSVVGYDRKLVLSSICAEPMSKTYIAFKEDKCVGYGVITQNIQGSCKLGPLHADDPAIAETLLNYLLVTFAQRKGFAAAIPSNNARAIHLMQKLGAMKVITSYRFYNEIVPLPNMKNIYACMELDYEPF